MKVIPTDGCENINLPFNEDIIVMCSSFSTMKISFITPVICLRFHLVKYTNNIITKKDILILRLAKTFKTSIIQFNSVVWPY